MIQREFHAMGTDWAILCQHAQTSALAEAENLVRKLEARFSRFLPESALSRLNSERRARDTELAAVLGVALELRQSTQGRFDPTLGACLISLGYDRDFDAVNRPSVDPSKPFFADLNIHIDGDEIILEGEGLVDLGGIAKGWAVDRAVEYLAAGGAKEILVDGGGAIRVLGGEWPIGVGDNHSVTLKSGAIATSSTKRRHWTSGQGLKLHHILDPHTGLPADTNVDTVTVIAADAVTADALATAGVVDLAGQLPRFLESGVQVAVRGIDGAWYTTPNWSENP